MGDFQGSPFWERRRRPDYSRRSTLDTLAMPSSALAVLCILLGLALKLLDAILPEHALTLLRASFLITMPAAAARAVICLAPLHVSASAGLFYTVVGTVVGLVVSALLCLLIASRTFSSLSSSLLLPPALARAIIVPMAVGVAAASMPPVFAAPYVATVAQAVIAPAAFAFAAWSAAPAAVAALNAAGARGVVKHDDAGRYAGDWVDDDESDSPVKQGHGVYVYPSGARYEGEWEHGKKDGRGVYTFASGASVAATWYDGKRQGYGVRNGVRLVKYRDDKAVELDIPPREARRRARAFARRAAGSAAEARNAAELAVSRAEQAERATPLRIALVPALAVAVAVALRLGSPPGSLYGALPLLDVLAGAHLPICCFAAGALLPCRGTARGSALKFARSFAVARHVTPLVAGVVFALIGVIAVGVSKTFAVAAMAAAHAALAFAAWPAGMSPMILASRWGGGTCAASCAALAASCLCACGVDALLTSTGVGRILVAPPLARSSPPPSRSPPVKRAPYTPGMPLTTATLGRLRVVSRSASKARLRLRFM